MNLSVVSGTFVLAENIEDGIGTSLRLWLTLNYIRPAPFMLSVQSMPMQGPGVQTRVFQ